jgi:hypothetical protein
MRIRRQITIVELFVVIAMSLIVVSLVMPVHTPSAGPLDHAAMKGNVAEARRLIDSGRVDVNRHGNMNRTALHYAALRGREDVARLLLAKGADPNARDYSRRTPLHYASPWIEITRLLVANGADINAEDKEGRTPLDYAADAAEREAVNDAHADSRNRNQRMHADSAEHQDYDEVVKFLISKGAKRSATLKDRR